MPWRLLRTAPAPGAWNMALDHALMDFAQRSGTCVFRVYEWSTPTLSLGRNQTARGGYDLARLADLGIPVVRRPTGGRAILHHREITYAVAAPENALGALRESYERINRLLLAGCRALGVAAEVATSASRTAAPGLAPCFASPSAGELMLAGRKLAGSAQFRLDGALLQHGSILVDNDQDLLPSLLLEPAPPTPTPATLHDALGRIPAPDEVAGVLFDAVRTLEDPGAESFVPDAALKAAAHSLLTHYTDDAWTWRR